MCPQAKQHQDAEITWRADRKALEGQYHQLLDEQTSKRAHKRDAQVVDVRSPMEGEPKTHDFGAGLTLESWCLRLIIGVLLFSVFGYLFLRNVVPHTTICMSPAGPRRQAQG